MFSKLKALDDSEKFRVIVFQYSAKNYNLELGIDLTRNSEISAFSKNSEFRNDQIRPFFTQQNDWYKQDDNIKSQGL